VSCSTQDLDLVPFDQRSSFALPRLLATAIGGVEHLADVVIGRDFLDPEQRLAVGAAMAALAGGEKPERTRSA
jgi:hypothetical protein